VAGKVKTWVWVVVGVAVVGVLAVVALAGVAAYFVARHIETTETTVVNAEQEFDRIKSAFGNEEPLIELDSRGHFVKANTSRTSKGSAKPPDELHLLAFDPADRRIVRFRIPFWLLRLKMGNATIDLNGNRMDLEDLRLSVDDLERYGPTLIVDHRSPDGERVLVWSQ
jgi:hypothetical protein